MGCACGRVTPILKPIALRDQSTHVTPQSQKQSIINKHYREDAISTNELTNTSIDSTDEFVKFENYHNGAFDKTFTDKRQQAINNESYRSIVHSWRPNSLQQLVTAIKSFTDNKSTIDSHWIIFYWITCNIEYDTISYFNNNYANQSAEAVFTTKKGVYAGYANIYKHICDALNMPCEIVSGYSKGYGFEERQAAPTQTDHAWNAVEIDQHWYLMESTWGAGHITEQKTFKRELDSYYFFPRPNEMIYHHFPENEQWQLLKTPINMEQYLKLPKIHPIYFQLNLDLVSPRNQYRVDLVQQKSYALVLIRTPSDVSLIGSLKLNNKKIEGSDRVFFDAKSNLYRCQFAPNAVGKHEVTIYARKGDSIGDYSAAVDFTLNIDKMPETPLSFPKTWQNYFDLNLEVVSPKNTHLIKLNNGQSHAEVLIRGPDDVALLGSLVNSDGEKVDGGHEVFYDGEKRLWRCNFAPNRDGTFDANILAKGKDDKGSYQSAVSFEIQANGNKTEPRSFPTTWPLFYELGLKIEAPRNRSTAVWPKNASFAEVRISAPSDVELSCSILLNGIDNENCALPQFDHDKQQWELLFTPQCSGLHQLIIYGRRKSAVSTSYGAVAEFGLMATKIRETIRFPEIYGECQSRRCRIYEPLNGELKKNVPVLFHYMIPGANEVDVKVDSKWAASNGYIDPLLKTKIAVGSKNVTVYAKYGENTNYDGLVRYRVI